MTYSSWRVNYFKLIRVLMLTLVSASLLSACASKSKLPSTQSEAEQARASLVEEARSQFSQAIDLINQDEVSNDDLDAAKEMLLSINKANPDYLGPIMNLGIIAVKQDHLAEAKGYFQQVVDLNASKNTAQHNQRLRLASLNYLGVVAREEGRFDEAEEYYREVLVADANNKAALRNLAILLDLYRGQLIEALALYEQYQGLLEAPDAKLKDWIFDINSRIKARGSE